MIDHRTTSPDAHITALSSLSQTLKARTRDDHQRTEKHPFMARLATGKIQRGEYARFLGQLFHVHRTLEESLKPLMSREPAMSLVVRDHHFRLAALTTDLNALGQSASEHPPLPATRLFCERIAALGAEVPLSLLGVLYVLEGATNGGRILAPIVRGALGLTDGAGTSFLDPHGAAQRYRWEDFKSALDTLALKPVVRDEVIAAAHDSFRGVHDILEDLTHPGMARVVPPAGRAGASRLWKSSAAALLLTMALSGAGAGQSAAGGRASQPKPNQPRPAAPARPSAPAQPAARSAPQAPGNAAAPEAGVPAPETVTHSILDPALIPTGHLRRLRAGYWWNNYGRYRRDTTVATGTPPLADQVPAAPVAVHAAHNYDGSVTVHWSMPSDASALGDVYQVGRRLPGQSDFWKVGETTVPSFTDRVGVPRAGNAQYEVVVRRGGPEGAGGVYGPVSAIASVNLNHVWVQSHPPSQEPDTSPPNDGPKTATPKTDVAKPATSQPKDRAPEKSNRKPGGN